MDKKGKLLRELEEMHESDLTPKQRRQLEWQRFQNMNWTERLTFFWDYYKWTLIVLFVLIIGIYEGIGIFHRLHQKVLLSMAIMDASLGSSEDVRRFSGDLADFLGTGDPDEVVDIDTALMSGDSVSATTKLTVVIGAGITDIIMIDAATYEKLAAQQAFRDWPEILGDSFEDYGDLFDDEGRMELSSNEKWLSYSLTWYEPIYCCMLASSEKTENAAALASFFAGNG